MKSHQISNKISLTVFFATLLFMMTNAANSQSLKDLNQLEGYTVSIYYSNGATEKSKKVAERFENAFAYYDSLVSFRPNVTLLVLSSDDWSKYTDFPVYGMPHYTNDQVLIVASEDNDFWKSFAPATNNLPKETSEQFYSAYTDAKGNLTMEPFFDLLALHELGHAYSIQGGLSLQKKWMGELFCNIFLHTYVAEKEPEILPALTLLPRISIEYFDRTLLKFSTLGELENNYDLIGKNYPANYAWYQFRWHMAADQIYNSIGIKALQLLWTNLQLQTEKLDDNEFVDFLRDSVHKCVADVAVNWEK